MSFKRDGNDPGLLSILQKRRIKDLLAESIPDNEAKLLANGRFTCLVCASRPIFDTVNMLTVHRNGNKHKASEEFHKKKKEELKQLIAKRRHDQFVKNGSTSINVAVPHHSGISNLSPYDSRARRSKIKLGDRKPRVNLQSTADSSNDPNSVTSKELEENDDDIPQSSSTPWQRICEQQLQEGPVKHDAQLKNIFRHKITEPPRLHPYAPKHKRCDKSDRNDISCSPNSYQESTNQGTSFPIRTSIHSTAPQTPLLLLQPPPPPPPPPASSSQSADKNTPDDSLCQVQETQAKKKLALKYYQLQGSGWKRDWDGKWIKDEQAEFDSDEEAPNLP